jgi:hypothetical protein
MHILPPSPATITVGHFDHLTIILDLQQLYYITILLTCQHFCSAAAARNSPRPKIDISFCIVWLGGWVPVGDILVLPQRRSACPSQTTMQ